MFQLTSLHGDVVATASANLAAERGLLSTQDYTECGRPPGSGTAGWAVTSGRPTPLAG